MKGFGDKHLAGYTFLEVVVAMAVMSAMASIAIPQYVSYGTKARTARCLANRYHIEMEEQAYFLGHDHTNLKINANWSCPSHGVYVWLISDPSEPGYPRVICSVHGSSEQREEETIEGLVARWGLDEGKGDTLGEGENAAKIDGTEWVNGKVGMGLKFDGHSKDSFSIGPSNDVQITGDLTVSLWVKLDSMKGKKVSLFTCKASGEKEKVNVLYQLQMDKKGNLHYQHEYGKGKDQKRKFTSSDITTDSWHLITVTRDTTSKTVDLYVNGHKSDTFSYKHNPTGGSSSILYFGSDLAKNKQALDGTIDEAAIYGRALTPHEIKSYYEMTK
jgi:type II secretory pathway pseudopilin PulG